jgi:hypothetical protein
LTLYKYIRFAIITTMLLYSVSITSRLKYICGFISKELGGLAISVTSDKEEYQHFAGPKINYSDERIPGDLFWIKAHTLLFEKTIKEQVIDCVKENGHTFFFKTSGDFPFDIFAAIFYLLSRYEEYLPHQKDMYGRYAHENSLAHKENFLDTPLVNNWLQWFKNSMAQKYPAIIFKPAHFTFVPTYDIDEAYSYRHKAWWRSAGAAVKDLLLGQWNRFSLRRSVLNKKMDDPFDSYSRIDDLHRPFAVKPHYFFLVPAKTGKYDRNILPAETAMQVLIKRHAEKYSTGVHPSWQSGDDPALIKSEIQTIEKITQQKVVSSRQHFIRFTLPHTYRLLIEAGIKEEYSMGYGSINGFRASVASSFYWYDLEKEEQTYLQVFPFCYMEANSFYEQKFTPQQALEEMRKYYTAVKAVHGMFITIWHNTFLGTDEKFAGWREVYEVFVNEIGHSPTVSV